MHVLVISDRLPILFAFPCHFRSFPDTMRVSLSFQTVYLYYVRVLVISDRFYWDAWDPYYVCEALFAVGNILNFTRLFQLLAINEHLGPMLISLERMIKVGYHKKLFNPYPAKFLHLNFQPLEVVSRYRDPQPHVVENYSYLFNLCTNICKSPCSDAYVIPNNDDLINNYNKYN